MSGQIYPTRVFTIYKYRLFFFNLSKYRENYLTYGVHLINDENECHKLMTRNDSVSNQLRTKVNRCTINTFFYFLTLQILNLVRK